MASSTAAACHAYTPRSYVSVSELMRSRAKGTRPALATASGAGVAAACGDADFEFGLGGFGDPGRGELGRPPRGEAARPPRGEAARTLDSLLGGDGVRLGAALGRGELARFAALPRFLAEFALTSLPAPALELLPLRVAASPTVLSGAGAFAACNGGACAVAAFCGSGSSSAACTVTEPQPIGCSLSIRISSQACILPLPSMSKAVKSVCALSRSTEKPSELSAEVNSLTSSPPEPSVSHCLNALRRWSCFSYTAREI
mmetsp:Transcript_86382/g.259155  ORF Transcript_86382/g.259155 Transcript_86382/m.259155 type:complete len:258 (-) Transcript_86382:540-1313(-)